MCSYFSVISEVKEIKQLMYPLCPPLVAVPRSTGPQLSLPQWFSAGGGFVSRTWQCLWSSLVVEGGERGLLLAPSAWRAGCRSAFYGAHAAPATRD